MLAVTYTLVDSKWPIGMTFTDLVETDSRVTAAWFIRNLFLLPVVVESVKPAKSASYLYRTTECFAAPLY